MRAYGYSGRCCGCGIGALGLDAAFDAAPSADCAAKATAHVHINAIGDRTINVTEDVELWYTGGAGNHGWVFRIEDQSAQLQLLSPLSSYPAGRGSWKLRITYEPE